VSGAPPLPVAPADQLRLLAAAKTMNDAWGAVLEICILTLCLPWEAVAIDLQRIDWDRGFVPVPSRSIERRALALSHEAQKAILRIAGEAAGRGQAVTAGRGPRLEARLFRMDRLVDRLAVAAPDTISLPAWNMHGIRFSGAQAMQANGASSAEIAATLGRSREVESKGLRGDVELARTGVERWNAILFSSRAPEARSPST